MNRAVTKIACVILNYNDADNCVKLAKQLSQYKSIAEIVVVDNCSTDESMDILKQYDSKLLNVVATKHNGGYGYGNNVGARYAFDVLNVDKVLICNPDVSFEDKLVSRLATAMDRYPNCGVASAIQYDKNGKEINESAWKIPKTLNYIFSTGKILSKFVTNFYYSKEMLHRRDVTPVDCVAGSLLLMSREAFEKTGGYDENVFLYCEETILGCKMKECGLQTYICSDVHYLHLHGISISKSVKSAIKRKQMLLKSHHYMLKNYLHANRCECALDYFVGKLSIAEEYIKAVLVKKW